MSFDALTLSAVRDELEPALTGARLQKAVFPDELSLAVEAFVPGGGRTHVLLSAHPEDSRVQGIPNLPARGIESETPFSLLVRKHLRDARIQAVRQPRLERVFELDCEQRDASGQHYRVLLIVEAMGRRSNLVLVDEQGVILDAARRSPPSRNSRRPVLPHLPYVAPPPQERLYPESVTAETLAAGTTGRSGSLARHLSDSLAGLSPLSGRELAFRATGATDTGLGGVDWPHVAEVARQFLSMVDTHGWQPTVAFDEDDRPLDFAPFVLTHLQARGARLVSYEGISAAMQAYYSGLAEAGPARRGDPLAAERRALLAPLARVIETTERRNAALAHQLENGHTLRAPLRRAGELILTHQADLLPGATELAVGDERIELDGTLSASDNAQAYFARYRKAREAEERVPGLLEAGRERAMHLADLRTLVELAEGMESVRALRREVGAATGSAGRADAQAARSKDSASERGARSKDSASKGGARSNDSASERGARSKDSASKGGARSKAVGQASGPHRRVALGEGWEALVGASAAGNNTVTFDLAQPEDLWLHARGVPGAHVILRTNGSTPPDEVVERAAALAAWHSAARTSGAVEVDITPRRYVKKIPNAPPGLVRFSNERTVRVTPQA